MEPIISPWLIYLIGISYNVAFCATLVGIVASLAGGFGMLICKCEQANDSTFNALRKTCFAGVAVCFVAALIPDRQWIVATMLANETTPDNIEMLVDSGVDMKNALKNDFIEILGELSNTEER